MSMDKEYKLSAEDITDPGLILEIYGIDYDEAASEIHAVEVNEDDEVVHIWKGLDAIIAIYATLGLKRAKVMKWPGIYQILGLGYKIVNKLRGYL